jgi:hypothetical protein
MRIALRTPLDFIGMLARSLNVACGIERDRRMHVEQAPEARYAVRSPELRKPRPAAPRIYTVELQPPKQ